MQVGKHLVNKSQTLNTRKIKMKYLKKIYTYSSFMNKLHCFIRIYSMYQNTFRGANLSIGK